jgi:hypothetical protein
VLNKEFYLNAELNVLTKIKKIQFSYKNKKLLELLEARGNQLKNANFAKAE